MKDLMWDEYIKLREPLMELARLTLSENDRQLFTEHFVQSEKEKKPGYCRRNIRDGLIALFQEHNEKLLEI